MIGVTAHGVYIPRARLNKKSIAAANAWFDGSLNSLAKGERAICNWDEDTITMAVEAVLMTQVIKDGLLMLKDIILY